MQKIRLNDESILFCCELENMENPVCLLFPEEKLLNLKLKILIEFSKWYLQEKVYEIEYETEDYYRYRVNTKELDEESRDFVVREPEMLKVDI